MNETGRTAHGYFPELDGLRGAAVLVVVLSHINHATRLWFPGMYAVIVFFVMSGFLITHLMLNEVALTGTLSIKRFYERRIIRLYPALLFYMLLFVPVLMALGATVTGTQIASGLFYFTNYYHIFSGYPPYNPIPILWSLSIEEHFYILFPFVIVFFRRNLRKAIVPLYLLCILALIWRAVLYHHCHMHPSSICGLPGEIRMHGTDTMFDCILYGCLAALLWHYHKNVVKNLFIGREVFLLVLCVIALCFATRADAFRETSRYSILSAASAIVVLNILYSDMYWLRHIFCHPVLRGVGKISYSLYLCHFGVLLTLETLLRSHELTGVSVIALYLVLSFLIATASYYLLEQPFMKLRKALRADHYGVTH